jgi:hypothetical protein
MGSGRASGVFWGVGAVGGSCARAESAKVAKTKVIVNSFGVEARHANRIYSSPLLEMMVSDRISQNLTSQNQISQNQIS